MKPGDTLGFYLAGLLVFGAVAALQPAPGYMDADYYYAIGQRLAGGAGLSEPFLWNYLNDPAGLPQPAHAYWMPLPSFLAALGMALAGSQGFTAARLFSWLIAASLPPLAAGLAFQLNQNRLAGLLAGGLAIFPGFYLPFLTTTDSFAVVMACGGLILLLLGRFGQAQIGGQIRLAAGLGAGAGLMHLARADGLLWLVPLGAAVLIQPAQAGAPGRSFSGRKALLLAVLLAGYLVVMGAWLLRNLAVFGTPLSPGGARALWLTSYDELFAYPGSLLSFAHWRASGLAEIICARLWALGQNLQTALAVQGMIFLAPLALIGGWRLRKQPAVRYGLLAWLVLLAGMTAAFPFVGARGGFFHAGAGVQLLVWGLAPAGLEQCVAWGVRRRGWDAQGALRGFGIGLVGVAVFLSAAVTAPRLLAPDGSEPAWGASAAHYRQVEAALAAGGALPGEIVMVNNPPGYHLAGARPAIVIPDGDETTLLAAARRYNARYLIVEVNYRAGKLAALSTTPGDRPGLAYLFSVGETRIYRILAEAEEAGP